MVENTIDVILNGLLDRALTNRMLTLKYKKVLIKGLAL
jgi:hypothetical protein